MKCSSAIVLAGGKSSRMGFDKQLIEIDQVPIVVYIGRRLKKFFDQIIIVTNTPELYEGEGFLVISDIYPGHGPISGIHAGLSASNSTLNYVTACDMPIISEVYLKRLLELVEEDDVYGAIVKRGIYIEPMNGIYSKDLLPEIESRIMENKFALRHLIEGNNFVCVDEDMLEGIDADVFLNLNIPEDLNQI